MSSTPLRQSSDRVPEYLPARMVNEYVYCPRLFYYEWVEGLFRESADTLEGKFQHRRVDEKEGNLPAPTDVAVEDLKTRSVTLASDRYGVIGRIDLLEISAGTVTPVDYKRGQPRESDEGLQAWPTDRIQLAVHALILRDNGYHTEEGVIYYAKTRQRVRVPFDEALLAEALETIAKARATAAGGRIPPPLVDSPKCPGCSLVGICLPDETTLLASETPSGPVQLSLFEAAEAARKPPAAVRPLVTPRDDLKPLYLNRQGLRVGKTGAVLQIRDKEALVEEVRIHEICQVNVMGNIQLSTQAIQTLCEAGVPICYFSQGGWFYGITTGLNSKNVFLRQVQFRLADADWFALALARRLVAGKIRNQRTMLQRNHVEPPAIVLEQLKQMVMRAEQARDLEELLGIEGNAARLYFGEFSGMLKAESDEEPPSFRFDFARRNRRPPRDPVNALLSLAYSLLAKDLTIACYAVGFDPFVGFYHQPRFGRPALALDLMEPFRPLIAESAVLSAINTRMVTEKDFVAAGPAVALTAEGRKSFFRAYELRMDSLITHPLFDYRVSYRRLLEIQARLLARVLEGEIDHYPVFVTR
jgi:CRISPR-associated protein Cas1